MGAATYPKSASAAPQPITLDLPIPPSVNRTRKIDWTGLRALRQFYLHSDLHLSVHGSKPAPVRRITGAYELVIEIPESGSVDLDNHVKTLIDYLVRCEFVRGDSPKFLRGFAVRWIDPKLCPFCRITITARE